jgi:hypothetical protein
MIAFMLIIQRDAILSPNFNDHASDNTFHVANTIEVARHLEKGDVFGFYDAFFTGVPLMGYYQPLMYLISASVYLILFKSVSVLVIHNTIVALVVSLFPVAVFYLGRSLRFNTGTSILSAFLSMLSIQGHGHSLEAYYELGTQTFALGALLFPLALGKYINFLGSHEKCVKDYLLVTWLLLLTLLAHQLSFYFLVISISVYTLIHLCYQSRDNLMREFRTLFLILFIFFLISSFWLYPKFFIHSEYSRTDLGSTRIQDNLMSSFTSKFFFDKLFSGEILDSTDNLGYDRDQNFKWATNKKYNRFPVITVFLFVGLAILIKKAKLLQAKQMIFLFLISIFLTIGMDDFPLLGLLPMSTNLQFLRFNFLFVLWSCFISAIGMMAFATFVASRAKKLHRFPYSREILVVAIILLFTYSALTERYFVSKDIARLDNPKIMSELETLLENAESGNVLLVNDASPTGFAPTFAAIKGFYTFGSLHIRLIEFARVINNPSTIATSPNLLDLYGVRYLLSQTDITDFAYPIKYGAKYGLYEYANSSFVSFFFPEFVPVEVFAENHAAVSKINSLWLDKYAIERIPHLIIKNDQQSENETILVDADLVILNKERYKGTAFLKTFSHHINYHTADVFTEEDRYLIMRRSYSQNWVPYIDGKRTTNYKISPYFNAVFVPKGQHLIEYRYQHSVIEWILRLISLSTLLLLLYLPRRINRPRVFSSFCIL